MLARKKTHPKCSVNTEGLADAQKTVSPLYVRRKDRKSNLVKVNILHPNVLHHGCLLVDVWSDNTESWAALPEHTYSNIKGEITSPCTLWQNVSFVNKTFSYDENEIQASLKELFATFFQKL